MPDKLTDNEIKKALECCMQNMGREKCKDCPLTNELCRSELARLSFDLINRLQAKNTVLLGKIEGLEANRVELLENIEQLESVITQIKAEAYKECVEKVKKELSLIRLGCRELLDNDGVFAIDMARKRVENLLKEKIGE